MYCFNFGPFGHDVVTVDNIAKKIITAWPGSDIVYNSDNTEHEAKALRLNIERTTHILNWKPIWDFNTALTRTVEWYQKSFNGSSAEKITMEDLDFFTQSPTVVMVLNRPLWMDYLY